MKPAQFQTIPLTQEVTIPAGGTSGNIDFGRLVTLALVHARSRDADLGIAVSDQPTCNPMGLTTSAEIGYKAYLTQGSFLPIDVLAGFRSLRITNRDATNAITLEVTFGDAAEARDV